MTSHPANPSIHRAGEPRDGTTCGVCGNALAAHRIPGRDCLYRPTPDERRRLRAAARRGWNRWWSSLSEHERREYARQWWSR